MQKRTLHSTPHATIGWPCWNGVTRKQRIWQVQAVAKVSSSDWIVKRYPQLRLSKRSSPEFFTYCFLFYSIMVCFLSEGGAKWFAAAKWLICNKQYKPYKCMTIMFANVAHCKAIKFVQRPHESKPYIFLFWNGTKTFHRLVVFQNRLSFRRRSWIHGKWSYYVITFVYCVVK